MSPRLNLDALHDLLHRAAETQRTTLELYTAALAYAQDPALREAWTRSRREIDDERAALAEVLTSRAFAASLGPDFASRPAARAPDWLDALRLAGEGGDPAAAQLAAVDCVQQAEGTAHLEWELIAFAAEALRDDAGEVLRQASARIEPAVEARRYQAQARCRSLRLRALGLESASTSDEPSSRESLGPDFQPRL